MAEPIQGRSRELIDAPNFCFVATLRADGTPHVVPVWVDADDGHILLNSARGRTWPRNAERDPRVTLTVQNLQNPYEYTTVRGRVVDVSEDGADAHIDKLAKKYLDKDTYPFRAPGEQRIIVKVEPEEVKNWGG